MTNDLSSIFLVSQLLVKAAGCDWFQMDSSIQMGTKLGKQTCINSLVFQSFSILFNISIYISSFQSSYYVYGEFYCRRFLFHQIFESPTSVDFSFSKYFYKATYCLSMTLWCAKPYLWAFVCSICVVSVPIIFHWWPIHQLWKKDTFNIKRSNNVIY